MMLDLLIEIQDNKEIIKKCKRELKTHSGIYSMKKIKDEFEQEKEKYKSIDIKLKKNQIEIENIENKLNTIKQEIISEENKLYKNLKYDLKLINSLEKSIESKVSKMKELEEENLKLLYEEEELSQQKECSGKKLITIKADFHKIKKNSNEKIIKIKQNIEKAEQNILNCEKRVPKELLDKFNRLSSIKGTGAARLSQGVCLGCKMKVAAMTIDNVKNHRGIVCCDNCGRIISYNKISQNQ
ncbi:zinc ribbon domain-containing protein [Clostridium sp. BJN0013]|uniref:zinc ribbon domain-containing protein n=1 Tax=Clostridium sp. BJN0013 TaxID=3236840 RepID=UPI0034C6B2E1